MKFAKFIALNRPSLVQWPLQMYVELLDIGFHFNQIRFTEDLVAISYQLRAKTIKMTLIFPFFNVRYMMET